VAIIKFIKRFYFFINILFCLYSLLVYQLVYSAEIKHWLAGFLMMSYPLMLIGNLFFFFTYIFVRPLKSLLSLITLLIVTLGIFQRTLKVIPPDIKPKDAFTFSVLSYNLMYGNYHSYKTGKDMLTGPSQKAVLDTLSSDIICLQEFYNDKRNPDFNLLKKLKKTRPHFVFMDKSPNHNEGQGAVGLAIFSRFPIINKEEVYWSPNNNGILSADLVINSDTLRLINFQLRSMGIRIGKILKKDNKLDTEETKNVISLLKEGFTSRGIQMNTLDKMISNSPYPVLAAGDLNELPYGYAYGRMNKKLRNAFEESGFGFGFTYHKILSFLRIDQQFYDKSKITNINFETLNEIPFSDHYPIKGWYDLK
jgi:endonuclease/exonuclease/phosphatase family metal-dependent hydrolase